MSADDSIPDPAAASATQAYFFSKSRVVFAFPVCIAVTVVPLLILAWFSLDPDWMPAKPDFSSRRKGYIAALIAWAFFVLFMKLPFWIRIPALLWSSYRFLRLFARLSLRAFDREPDFVISPHGVSGWSGHGFQHVPWTAVTRLDVTINQPKFGPFDLGSPKRSLTFHGPEAGERRFFNTLPPARIMISYWHGGFPEPAETILRTVRRYRPDLVKEENLAEPVRRRSSWRAHR